MQIPPCIPDSVPTPPTAPAAGATPPPGMAVNFASLLPHLAAPVGPRAAGSPPPEAPDAGPATGPLPELMAAPGKPVMKHSPATPDPAEPHAKATPGDALPAVPPITYLAMLQAVAGPTLITVATGGGASARSVALSDRAVVPSGPVASASAGSIAVTAGGTARQPGSPPALPVGNAGLEYQTAPTVPSASTGRVPVATMSAPPVAGAAHSTPQLTPSPTPERAPHLTAEPASPRTSQRTPPSAPTAPGEASVAAATRPTAADQQPAPASLAARFAAPGPAVPAVAAHAGALATAPAVQPVLRVERPATVAELPSKNSRPDSVPKPAKESGVLIPTTGPFASTAPATGTATAQPAAMSHGTQSWHGDAAATVALHRDPAPAHDPSPAAPARAAQAVAAVNVALEHASRDRNSVQLHFDVAGERLDVLVQRHVDEVRATFKADSPELRTALSQEWQASAAERPASAVQPIFTDHASDPAMGDAASRGFAGQEGSPRQQESGGQAGGGEWHPRRAAPPSAPVRATAAAPAARHLTSVHFETTA